MGDDSDKPDALLDKLDGLMRSGRAPRHGSAPPVLTEALPDDLQGPIPTLTNAIDKRLPGSAQSPLEGAEKVQDVIASRLVDSVDREMADIVEELPALEDKLKALRRSIKFALPQLVNLRWDDAPVKDDDADAADDTGTNPD